MAAGPVLPATLRLGPVHVTVRDLDRAIAWYDRALGLALLRREDGVAELGDDAVASLVLHEDPLARPAGRHSGLYHYALLYPSRQELARAAVRLAATRTPIQGASDHGTHEAIYLPDEDGNGIELAADRPREVWPSFEEEFARGGPAPLDVDDLLATIEGEGPRERVGEGLRVGHVHLHVGSVEDGLAFYRDILGFEQKADLGSAAFVSAGGYHHHLGFNVWRGEGAPPVPEHVAGLHHWTIVLDDAEQVAEVRARAEAAGVPVQADGDGAFTVRDPWGIPVRVEAAR
jgi:catechol 2,3-dioxygenase